MPDGNFKCTEHSGCVARIVNLETSQTEQWSTMDKHKEHLDRIFTRLNAVLGGVVVACILLALNLLLKR